MQRFDIKTNNISRNFSPISKKKSNSQSPKNK